MLRWFDHLGRNLDRHHRWPPEWGDCSIGRHISKAGTIRFRRNLHLCGSLLGFHSGYFRRHRKCRIHRRFRSPVHTAQRRALRRRSRSFALHLRIHHFDHIVGCICCHALLVRRSNKSGLRPCNHHHRCRQSRVSPRIWVRLPVPGMCHPHRGEARQSDNRGQCCILHLVRL